MSDQASISSFTQALQAADAAAPAAPVDPGAADDGGVEVSNQLPNGQRVMQPNPGRAPAQQPAQAQEDITQDQVEEQPAEEALPDPEAPAPRTIHGMDAEQLLAELEAGRIPDQLLEALSINIDENGQPVPRSLKEVRSERLRAGDYSRKTRELAEQRTQLETTVKAREAEVSRKEAGFQHVLQTLAQAAKDPVSAYDLLEELGADMHALAVHHARMIDEMNGLPPQFQQRLMEARKKDMMLRQAQRRAEAAERAAAQRQQEEQQRAQGNSAQAMVQRANAFLEAKAPAIFQKHGLPLTPASAKLVADQFATIYRQDPSAELNEADIEEAVVAAVGYLEVKRDEHRAALQPTTTAGARPGALPPRPGAAPAPAAPQAPAARPGQQQRGSLKDLQSAIFSGALR